MLLAGFTGTFENRVDGKGRVSLPADFRDVLNDDSARSFYLFPSPNHSCLEASDGEYLKRIMDSIEVQTDIFSDEEDLLSLVLQQARRVQYDSTGRFVLPAEFAKYATIDNQATFVGRGARFQIWMPQRHQTYLEKLKAQKFTLRLRSTGKGSP